MDTAIIICLKKQPYNMVHLVRVIHSLKFYHKRDVVLVLSCSNVESASVIMNWLRLELAVFGDYDVVDFLTEYPENGDTEQFEKFSNIISASASNGSIPFVRTCGSVGVFNIILNMHTVDAVFFSDEPCGNNDPEDFEAGYGHSGFLTRMNRW